MIAALNKRTRRLLLRAAATSGLTIADVMAAGAIDMRAACRWLRQHEGTGRLVRSGGAGRIPFRWTAALEATA